MNLAINCPLLSRLCTMDLNTTLFFGFNIFFGVGILHLEEVSKRNNTVSSLACLSSICLLKLRKTLCVRILCPSGQLSQCGWCVSRATEAHTAATLITDTHTV
jgi:hypothetical protein